MDLIISWMFVDMAKLILKGLIKKRWQRVPNTKRSFYVVDKVNKKSVKIVEPSIIRDSIKNYYLLFTYYDDKAWYSLKGQIIHFNKYFEDWQNPTKNEIILFELETGMMYIDYYLGLRTWSYEE